MPFTKCVIFIFFLLWFAGCRREASLPLSKEKSIAVLMDVHVAETAMSGLKPVVKDSLAKIYYDQIATLHDIPRETLDSTVAMLQRDPELMEAFYTTLQEMLEKKILEAQ